MKIKLEQFLVSIVFGCNVRIIEQDKPYFAEERKEVAYKQDYSMGNFRNFDKWFDYYVMSVGCEKNTLNVFICKEYE